MRPRDGVFVPGTVRLAIGEAAPQVDDGAAVHVDAARPRRPRRGFLRSSPEMHRRPPSPIPPRRGPVRVLQAQSSCVSSRSLQLRKLRGDLGDERSPAPVRCLADDLEPVRGEQCGRTAPEARVVVDYDDLTTQRLDQIALLCLQARNPPDSRLLRLGRAAYLERKRVVPADRRRRP